MTLGRRYGGAFHETRGSGLNTVFYYRVTVKYVMYVNPPGIADRRTQLPGKGEKNDGKMAPRGKNGEGVRRRNEKEIRLKAVRGGEGRQVGKQTGFEVTEFKATAGKSDTLQPSSPPRFFVTCSSDVFFSPSFIFSFF